MHRIIFEDLDNSDLIHLQRKRGTFKGAIPNSSLVSLVSRCLRILRFSNRFRAFESRKGNEITTNLLSPRSELDIILARLFSARTRDGIAFRAIESRGLLKIDNWKHVQITVV